MAPTGREDAYSSAIAVAAAGVAPLIYTPLSNLYGRRPVVLLSTPIGIAGHVACAVCHNWPAFLIARACVGIGTSVGMGIGPTIVADLYYARHRGR